MTLNLEFAWEGGRNEVETPRTLSLSEGFREVKTTGGMERKEFVSAEGGGSDSEEEFGMGERSPLVKI